MNIIMRNEKHSGKFFEDLGKQGSILSKVANLFPGMNAMAGLHDYWFNRTGTTWSASNHFQNFGTMPIAYGISAAAVVGNVARNNEWVFFHAFSRSGGR